MTSILAANVKALRSRLGRNQTEFADLLKVQQSYISKWETKGIEPMGDSIAAMAELAGCSFEAFKTKPLPAASVVPDQPVIRTDGVGETVGILQLDLSLSMGPGTAIEDFVESETVSFDASVLRRITRTPSDRLRFVTGIGTSHEPKFQSGDQFLIDINERTLSRLDGYYWITFDGAHALKRLRPLGNGMVQIVSENPDFGPLDVPRADVRIEGRAIWFARGL